MQKIINAVAACTFVLALANTAVIVLAVTRGPSLVKKQISEMKLELTQMLVEMVPSQIDGALPEFPKTTGPAVPFGQ